METEELSTLINQIQDNTPDNIMEIFFVKKPSAIKMQSFQPQVSSQVQHDILNIILPCVKRQLESTVLVDYNPVGVADGEIECLNQSSVSQLNDFLESISQENLYKEMKNLSISQISFYCIKIAFSGKTLYLFRQFAKMKKLRSGYVARFFNDELVAMEDNFLGIDENTDMIYFNDKIYILNHISLERIFNYRDVYLQKTNEAMGELLRQGVFKNLEQFNEDCCRDVRIMKRFTNIMTQGRLPLFFENYEKVPDIVRELGLEIEFDEDSKIIYREKSQLFHIINLMSDAYFKSLLANRMGIVKTEEVLPC